MKSHRNYNLFDLRISEQAFNKFVSNDLPSNLNQGRFGELIRDISDYTGIDQNKCLKAFSEVANDVYEEQFDVSGADLTQKIEKHGEICEKTARNMRYWKAVLNFSKIIIRKSCGGIRELYDHQKEMLENIDVNTDGQIYAPGGSGKTWVFTHTIHKVANEDGGTVQCVFVPKIALSTQQVAEIFERVNEISESETEKNKSFRFLCIHSGEIDPHNDDNTDFLTYIAENADDLNSTIEAPDYELAATTDPGEIEEEYRKANENDENLVIISTYHSSRRINEALCTEDGPGVDFVVADEAHHVAQNQFYIDANEEPNNNNVQFQTLFDCPHHYYTATPRYRQDELGMRNEKLFGEVFCVFDVSEIINRGLLVPLALQDLRATRNNQTLYQEFDAATEHIWNCHYLEVEKEDSDFAPNELTNLNDINIDSSNFDNKKLLITCRSRNQIARLRKHIRNNKEKFIGDPTVYSISSEESSDDEYGVHINSDETPRSEWMKTLREDEGDAIILHYQVIGEGVDVPGITGLTFYRTPGANRDLNEFNSSINLVQTLFRAMRILPSDKYRKKYENYKKQEAVIYIPNIDEGVVNENSDGNTPNLNFEGFQDHLRDILTRMYRGNTISEMFDPSPGSSRGEGGLEYESGQEINLEDVNALENIELYELLSKEKALRTVKHQIEKEKRDAKLRFENELRKQQTLEEAIDYAVNPN